MVKNCQQYYLKLKILQKKTLKKHKKESMGCNGHL